MITATMNIAIQEIKGYLRSDTLEGCLRTAMEQARYHWLITNEDERFRSAVGAVMLHYGVDSPEFKRIEVEMKALQRFGAGLAALQAGISVDLNELLPDEGELSEPIGLLALWREVKAR